MPSNTRWFEETIAALAELAPFDRSDDPARIRRHQRPKVIGQITGETICAVVGHRPRERKPTYPGQQWLAPVCGRCGIYPVPRSHP